MKTEPMKSESMKTWSVKMCTQKDLCSLYGVSDKIIKQHLKPFLKEVGEKRGNFFSIHQVLKIIELLGEPAEVTIKYPSTYNPTLRNPLIESK